MKEKYSAPAQSVLWVASADPLAAEENVGGAVTPVDPSEGDIDIDLGL